MIRLLAVTDCSRSPNLLSCANQASGGGKDLGSGAIGGVVSGWLNLFIYIIGAVAIIMLILGGLRYVLSGGDPKATQDAKNTIVYAIIGLVVAIAAYAFVNYVITALK